MAGTPVFGTGGFLANDLGADWIWQSSDGAESQQVATATNGDGDGFLQQEYDSHSTGSENYLYNGTVGSYNGTAGACASFLPGKYLSTAAVALTGVDIDYSPCASGQRETVKFSWSNGLAADSRTYAMLPTLPTKMENDGVPELGTNGNADSRVQSSNYSIKCDEGRSLNATGTRFAGATYNGTEDINETHVGLPAMTFAAGWKFTTKQEGGGEGSGSNTSYKVYNTTATKSIVHS